MEITLIGYESTANYLGLCKLKLFLFPTINSHYNLRFLYFFVALKPLVITNISAFLLFISMTKSYTWTIVLFQYVGSLICISGKLKAALHLCFFSYFSLCHLQITAPFFSAIQSYILLKMLSFC